MPLTRAQLRFRFSPSKLSPLRDVDDLLTSGTQLEKLLVVHPIIAPAEVQVLYTAYDGWIYSGRYQWSLDKFVLTDSSGKKKSFCKEIGQQLPSGIPVTLKLQEGECTGSSIHNKPDYPILPFKKVVCVIVQLMDVFWLLELTFCLFFIVSQTVPKWVPPRQQACLVLREQAQARFRPRCCVPEQFGSQVGGRQQQQKEITNRLSESG